MAKQSTLVRCMALLSAAYPGVELAEQTPKLYHRLLADIPDELLEIAVLDHISRSPFYPKVSELRGAMVRLSNHRQTAIEAWGDVYKAIRHGGYDSRPEFRNPITARVVDAMGWKSLCRSTNEVADRARFMDSYNELKERDTSDAVALPQVAELARKLSGKRDRGWRLLKSYNSIDPGEGRYLEYDGDQGLREVPALEAGNADGVD